MTQPIPPLVVDVRSPGEFSSGHVVGAINLPLSHLMEQATSVLPKRDAPLLLCCVSGARSDMAEQWLRAQGYTQVANGGSVGSVALRLGLPIERD
ncbi:MAG: rhodanese-like domain-containing protein [Burkholderiaceae bacterium]|nr:MAG: rhodanese-like domain-containing protein [Burkholderiaceae bacterium]